MILHILNQGLALWDKGTEGNELVFSSGARKQWALGYDNWWLMGIKILSNLKRKTLKVQLLLCRDWQRQLWMLPRRTYVTTHRNTAEKCSPTSNLYLLTIPPPFYTPFLGEFKGALSIKLVEPTQKQTGRWAFAAFKEKKKVLPDSRSTKQQIKIMVKLNMEIGGDSADLKGNTFKYFWHSKRMPSFREMTWGKLGRTWSLMVNPLSKSCNPTSSTQ